MAHVQKNQAWSWNKILVSFTIAFVGWTSVAQAQSKSKDILKDMISLVSTQVAMATAKNQPIQLSQAAQKSIVTVQNDMIVRLKKQYPHIKDSIRFDDSICTAATWAMRQLAYELKRPSTLMFTYERVAQSGFYHYYLVFKNVLKPGDRYIVDPTIRQFYVNILTKAELSQVPELFVGSAQDLRAMAYRSLKKYKSKSEIKRYWIDSYLHAEERTTYQ